MIAASNAKLLNLVSQGKFRRDLFYRLDIMSIELPPLSQRTGDIELLAEHFLNKYKLQYNQPDKYLHPETMQWMSIESFYSQKAWASKWIKALFDQETGVKTYSIAGKTTSSTAVSMKLKKGLLINSRKTI
jgi:sigma54-dependent transcription regulator